MSEFDKTSLSLLQVEDVARLVKVSSKTVRRWIAANELAAIRLGRSVRISEAELARFIAARTSSSNIGCNK